MMSKMQLLRFLNTDNKRIQLSRSGCKFSSLLSYFTTHAPRTRVWTAERAASSKSRQKTVLNQQRTYHRLEHMYSHFLDHASHLARPLTSSTDPDCSHVQLFHCLRRSCWAKELKLFLVGFSCPMSSRSGHIDVPSVIPDICTRDIIILLSSRNSYWSYRTYPRRRYDPCTTGISLVPELAMCACVCIYVELAVLFVLDMPRYLLCRSQRGCCQACNAAISESPASAHKPWRLKKYDYIYK